MMDNVTNELLLEHLTRIQAQLSEMGEFMVSLGVRTAGTDHVVAGQQLKLAQYADDISALRNRLERIEKRPDLVE